jgi:uncharacterized protein YyaL (SSP411 family)
LNALFVCIKLDREERPDIDHMYMEACVAMTGQGGWPLSCFLTPDKKPFYTGTYYPKEDYYNTPSFKRVLLSIATLWKDNRQKLLKASDEVMGYIGKPKKAGKGQAQDAPEKAYRELARSFDAEYGGFGGAPKFPSAHNLLFLLSYGLVHQEKNALAMAGHTLACMARGGMFDHIGGGFCRYSTDERWLVPHFEKMMYDNAMLLMAYAEAGALIDEKHFATAKRIAQYCFAQMRDTNGGFYTAEDADSEGEEGKFYLFSPEEAKEALRGDAARFCMLFDITEKGNFEGKSIPNHIGRELSAEDEAFAAGCFPRLYAYREKRVHPFKDDKILTSVNGLMIAALSIAGRLMGQEEYTQAAQDCAKFILHTMQKDSRLYASFRQGKTAHPGTLDDYAFLAWGLMELYQASQEAGWLIEADSLVQKLITLFGDEGGAFFMSGDDVSDTPVRPKNTHDGALPSGNAIAAMVLLRLASLLDNDTYAKKATDVLAAVSGEMQAYPSGFTALLLAQMLHSHGLQRIAITAGDGKEVLLGAFRGGHPFADVIACQEDLRAIAPHLEEYKSIEGKAAAYICDRQGCRPPVMEPEALVKALMLD